MGGEGESYEPTAEGLVRLLERLRAPDGCPWDRAQTRETLGRSLAGETAELLDAIDRGDAPAICDELGDVLMNALFQAVLARERGEFTAEDVFRGVIAKMIRRHAHIFGDEKAETPEEVTAVWRKVKAAEQASSAAPESILDKVPRSLSALDRAEKLQKKAAKVGFDWSDEAGILDKIEEELRELREAVAAGDASGVDAELGDLLMAASNLARFRGGRSSEELLRAANRRFENRFRFIERTLAEEQIPLESAGIERMEALWCEAKRREQKEQTEE